MASYIKARKHAARSTNPPFASAAAATLIVMAMPVGAQTRGDQHVEGSAGAGFRAPTTRPTPPPTPSSRPRWSIRRRRFPVIKEQVLREQGATTLTEALRNTPGASTFFLGENGNTNTGDTIYMRGFDSSSSIFVDGIRDLGSVSRDTFNIEQVEVVKGPAGTDVGRTSPTGYINMITKKPSLEDSFNGSLGFGKRELQARQCRLEQVAQRRERHRRSLPAQCGGR